MYGKKIVMGALIALFACMLMGGAAFAQPTVDKSGYSCLPGEDVTIRVTEPVSTLNTTNSSIDQAYYLNYTAGCEYFDLGYQMTNLTLAEIKAMTDFKVTTFFNLTYRDNTSAMREKADYDSTYYFILKEGLTSFDGIWCKKSVYIDVEFSIGNTTYGEDSFSYVSFDDTNPYGFEYNENLSYKYVDYVEDSLYNDYSVSQWVAQYGYIDEVVIWTDVESGGGPIAPLSISNEPTPQAHILDMYCLLYEWHLFNRGVTITDVFIADEDYDAMAWATTITPATSALTIINIHVPSSAKIGTYFVEIVDSQENDVTTTLNVQTPPNNIWIWLWPLAFWVAGAGLMGTADVLADTKTNKVTVVLVAAVGVLVFAVGVLMATDILGYTSMGIMPAGLCLPAVSKGRSPTDARRKVKKIAAFGMVGLLALCLCVPFACATESVSPLSKSISPGDTFVISFYDTNGALVKADMLIKVKAVDGDVWHYVYWTNTVTVASNGESGTVTFVTEKNLPSGSYTVDIYNTNDDLVGSASIFVKAPATLNWQIIFAFGAMGILFLAISAVGWGHAKKTKTILDDFGLIVVAFMGVLMIILAVAYYLGYFTI